MPKQSKSSHQKRKLETKESAGFSPKRKILSSEDFPSCSASFANPVSSINGDKNEVESKENDSFMDNDEDFEDYISSLSTDVMCGSQPLPKNAEEFESCFEASHLPNHVLENIFSSLPASFLFGVCTQVCSRWNNLIKNEQYMPWKKRYSHIRLKDAEAYNLVKALLLPSDPNPQASNSSQNVSWSYIIRFIDVMGCWRITPLSEQERCSLKRSLSLLPHFESAQVLLEKKILQDDPPNQRDSHESSWMLAAILLIISPDVCSINLLRKALLRVFPSLLVMDFLYAASSLTWVLYKEDFISQEYHYRIFCCISHIENSSTPLPRVYDCRRIGDMRKLTHEQLKIASHVYQTDDLVRVIAYAGTGKTTTLVACVKSSPNTKFLYTSFSKAVVDESRRMFMECGNVECRTIHSLAYGAMDMKNYTYKLDRTTMRSSYVGEVLRLSKAKDPQLPVLILKTVNSFIASRAMGLEMIHVPQSQRVKEEKIWKYEQINEKRKKRVLKLSKKFWNRISDLADKKWTINDDCYLKQWQLSAPDMRDYDVILLDEAQDCSECMRDILERQRGHCALVFVGDSHQQIYAFRKATDALISITPSHTYYLTQSFRFGNEIAQVADCILQSFMFAQTRDGRRLTPLSDKTLLGVGQPGTVFGQPIGSPSAILCRTNLGVIEKVLSTLSKNSLCRVAIVGGAAKLGLGLLEDLYALSKSPHQRLDMGLKVKQKRMRKFTSLKHVEDDANATDDEAMLSKIEIVKALKDRIPEAVQILRSLPDISEDVEVVVSTVHKAKGLEFDTVILCDDFAKNLVEIVASGKALSRFHKEEANLLYVAATRAKRSLVMSQTLCKLLEHCKVRFITPVPAFKVLGGGSPVFCVRCKKPLTPQHTIIIMQQPKIDKMQDEGSMCFNCGRKYAPGWGGLLGTTEA